MMRRSGREVECTPLLRVQVRIRASGVRIPPKASLKTIFLNYFIKNNKSILSKDRELYDYYLKAMEKIKNGTFIDSLPSDEELGKYGVRMGICAKRIAMLMELKAPELILQNEKCMFIDSILLYKSNAVGDLYEKNAL